MLFCLLIFIGTICSHYTGADLCQTDFTKGGVNGSEVDAGGGVTQTALISCPRPEDPQEFTACCFITAPESGNATGDGPDVASQETGESLRCCNPEREPVLLYFISDKMALIIAVIVTAVLLVITVIIVVCCFWSRCPLYMMCRVRYRQDDIIAYASKDDETTNLNDMPPEEQKGVTVYSPNAVKVTLKDDV